jgi:hypothetical protein
MRNLNAIAFLKAVQSMEPNAICENCSTQGDSCVELAISNKCLAYETNKLAIETEYSRLTRELTEQECGGKDMTEMEIMRIVENAQTLVDAEIEKHRESMYRNTCKTVYLNSFENFCIEQTYNYFSEYLANLPDEEFLQNIDNKIAEGLDILCRKNIVLSYLSHELCNASYTVNPADFYRVIEFIEKRLQTVTGELKQ